ncbi:MAG TPA: hypothetical protein VE133_04615, partial [Candidatus Sulfotelmatobacter sp.]|nr:hypothetical protein [Candidatus Sulfotelmatobacter sp.]
CAADADEPAETTTASPARGEGVKLCMVLLCLALTGCAGMIFSHKPYHLTQGKVTMANTHTVILDWPVDRRYWCGQETLCLGEFVHHVCPETVPAVGTVVKSVDLTWDKPRKCWLWQSR